MKTINDRQIVTALLSATTSTGMLDAVSLHDLETFTGCMTRTITLAGIDSAGGVYPGWPGAVALSAFSVMRRVG